MGFKEQLKILGITAVISIIANWIGPKVSPVHGIPGVLILAAICVLGLGIGKIMPGNIPAVAYIVTLGTILTVPGVPFSDVITDYTSKVDFTTLCTPILAYSGIYTGSNLADLKRTGPKIVILAIFVMVGTYIGSAVIAQIVLKSLGQI